MSQIRAGFLVAESAEEKVRRFRAERIARIVAGDTPIPLGGGAKLIFHAVPVGDTDAWSKFRSLSEEKIIPVLRPIAAGAIGGWHFNLDGFIVRTDRRNKER